MSLILAILLFITTFLNPRVTAKPGFSNFDFDKNEDPTPITSSEIDAALKSWQETLQEMKNQKPIDMDSFKPDEPDLSSFNHMDFTLPPFPTLAPYESCYFNCNRDTFPLIPVIFGVAILKITLVSILIYRRMKRRRAVIIFTSQVVQDQQVLVQNEVQPNNDEPPSYAVANQASDKIPPPPYEP